MKTPQAEPSTSAPFLAATLAASQTNSKRFGIGITLINFNTSRQTLRCIESLRASTLAPDWLIVLDNASVEEDFSYLVQQCIALPESEVRIYRSNKNLGFAAGSNFLIDVLLAEPNRQCQYCGLLNNDAVAMPDMLQLLVTALDSSEGKAGLAGGRMHRLVAPYEVDTLGISLYCSLMPADRKCTDEPYLGPTGGCCIATRELLEQLKIVSSYYFDARYFCYCEDTDMVLRTVLLGFKPAYIDQIIALHEGQASSGGVHTDFITYHGIRNSIWMQVKLLPRSILLKYGCLLLLAHILTIGRHTLSGRFSMLTKLYLDAFSILPQIIKERKIFSRHIRLTTSEIDKLIAPRFYRKGYLMLVMSQFTRKKAT